MSVLQDACKYQNILPIPHFTMWHASKLLFDVDNNMSYGLNSSITSRRSCLMFDWFGSRSTFNIGLTHKKFDLIHESGTVDKKPSKWPSSKIAPCFQIQTDPISSFMVFCSWTILRVLYFIDPHLLRSYQIWSGLVKRWLWWICDPWKEG